MDPPHTSFQSSMGLSGLMGGNISGPVSGSGGPGVSVGPTTSRYAALHQQSAAATAAHQQHQQQARDPVSNGTQPSFASLAGVGSQSHSTAAAIRSHQQLLAGSANLGYPQSDQTMPMVKGAQMPGQPPQSYDVPYDITSDFPALGQRSNKAPEFSLGQDDFPTLGSRSSGSRAPGYGSSSAASSSGMIAQQGGGTSGGYESVGASGVGSGGLASLRAGASPISSTAGGPPMGASHGKMEHGAVGSPSVSHGSGPGSPGSSGTGLGAVGTGAASGGGAAQTRYGLLGLLSVIQYTDQDLNTLALGVDLTTLGLNLSSSTSLYSTFASPFADKPTRRSPEYHLPLCYYIPMQPATAKMTEFSDETLFYMFYNLPRDRLQIAAARELFRRDWRYHKEMQRWFSRVPDTEPLLKTQTYERGTYVYFDPLTWEQVRKYNFVLMYNQLDNAPPELPPAPARPATTSASITGPSSSS
eukprot:CAMPEP_0174229996 /NCGR_PEP_ID=MMETSP0417-20130205/835_1 /TAXON_ID=242541 /ORGANISM="Mayorella sp, Strain BSH-02190019" /LENGTH=470 /DNA_ID=CAMNT_0015307613 /DNA_START=57 /DNA_END=1466 /DNA_ORIENTATION=-